MLGIAIIVSALLLISIKYVDDISDRFNRWWKYARFFVGVAMVFTLSSGHCLDFLHREHLGDSQVSEPMCVLR